MAPTSVQPCCPAAPFAFTLAPNPTDAKGREMLRQEPSPLSPRRTVLNLEGLPAATYFVTVTLAGLSATQKLVVK